MDLRPLQPHEHGLAAELWLESFRSASAREAAEPELGALAERLSREADWSSFLVWEDNAPVGFLAVNVNQSRLDQLFVAPASQRRGLGLRLLEHAKRMMPAGFSLRTIAANAGARRFYERHGLELVDNVDDRVVYQWRPSPLAGEGGPGGAG